MLSWIYILRGPQTAEASSLVIFNRDLHFSNTYTKTLLLLSWASIWHQKAPLRESLWRQLPNTQPGKATNRTLGETLVPPQLQASKWPTVSILSNEQGGICTPQSCSIEVETLTLTESSGCHTKNTPDTICYQILYMSSIWDTYKKLRLVLSLTADRPTKCITAVAYWDPCSAPFWTEWGSSRAQTAGVRCCFDPDSPLQTIRGEMCSGTSVSANSQPDYLLMWEVYRLVFNLLNCSQARHSCPDSNRILLICVN